MSTHHAYVSEAPMCRLFLAEWQEQLQAYRTGQEWNGRTAPVLVTDPPYGTGGWRRFGPGQGYNPKGALVKETWDDIDLSWLRLNARAIITFWSAQYAHLLLPAAYEAGYTKQRCLYMRKRDPKPAVHGNTRWSVEPIWVLSQDGFVLHGGEDIMETTAPRFGRDAEAVGHPYQKPLSVLLWLLGKLPPKDLWVCDPFAGSGTTLVAAKRLGIDSLGCESAPEYFHMAVKRLEATNVANLALSEAYTQDFLPLSTLDD
jgi:site-specific DNA-methyltransferase (adenine-specific)